jgi:outer membrane protein assembly factor BamB
MNPRSTKQKPPSRLGCKPRRRLLLLSLGILSPGLLSLAHAQDWPQWRGPNRDAHVAGFAAPAAWPKELSKKWSVEVGIGHSSPLIVGNRAFQFARQGENEVTRCLDLATGRELWKDSYPAPYEMNPAARGHAKGPKSTPTVAAGRVYTFGIGGILSCLDAATGKVFWRHEYAKEYKNTSPTFGAAASPLVDNGLLYVHVGGPGVGALSAYDAKTGAGRWQWKGDGPAYASPVIVSVDGTRHLITQTQTMIVGLEASSGKLLWSMPFKTPYEQNIITPFVAKGLVVFAGLQNPMFAVRLKKTGDSWAAGKVWECRDANQYMSTPVTSGSRIYGMSSKMRGQMFSVDAATGKVLWSDQGRFGDNASVYDAGAMVLALNTEAELHVYAKDGDGLKQVAQYQVAESPTWASPAVQGGRILVKDQDHLTLWEIPK